MSIAHRKVSRIRETHRHTAHYMHNRIPMWYVLRSRARALWILSGVCKSNAALWYASSVGRSVGPTENESAARERYIVRFPVASFRSSVEFHSYACKYVNANVHVNMHGWRKYYVTLCILSDRKRIIMRSLTMCAIYNGQLPTRLPVANFVCVAIASSGSTQMLFNMRSTSRICVTDNYPLYARTLCADMGFCEMCIVLRSVAAHTYDTVTFQLQDRCVCVCVCVEIQSV